MLLTTDESDSVVILKKETMTFEIGSCEGLSQAIDIRTYFDDGLKLAFVSENVDWRVDEDVGRSATYRFERERTETLLKKA